MITRQEKDYIRKMILIEMKKENEKILASKKVRVIFAYGWYNRKFICFMGGKGKI